MRSRSTWNAAAARAISGFASDVLATTAARHAESSAFFTPADESGSMKDAASACSDLGKPFDLWTGLFAIGGTYCDGGTYSRALGQPKATAVRVCAYYADDLALCEHGQ